LASLYSKHLQAEDKSPSSSPQYSSPLSFVSVPHIHVVHNEKARPEEKEVKEGKMGRVVGRVIAVKGKRNFIRNRCKNRQQGRKPGWSNTSV